MKNKKIEIKEKGVWIVYDLDANREIQKLLTDKGFIFRFDPSLKIERRINLNKIHKVIDKNWERLVFDLHTRFCKMADVDGKTHKMCNRFKEALKEDLKRMIK